MALQACTFGTRPPININKLNDIIFREMKYFRNYKIYRPNFGSIPLTGKFYAAHDQLKIVSEEESKKIEDYYMGVEQSRAKGPLSKHSEPVTENQVYGWISTPLVPLNKKDDRFYFPQYESENTKIQAMILMCNPRSKKSKKITSQQ